MYLTLTTLPGRRAGYYLLCPPQRKSKKHLSKSSNVRWAEAGMKFRSSKIRCEVIMCAIHIWRNFNLFFIWENDLVIVSHLFINRNTRSKSDVPAELPMHWDSAYIPCTGILFERPQFAQCGKLGIGALVPLSGV